MTDVGDDAGRDVGGAPTGITGQDHTDGHQPDGEQQRAVNGEGPAEHHSDPGLPVGDGKAGPGGGDQEEGFGKATEKGGHGDDGHRPPVALHHEPQSRLGARAG